MAIHDELLALCAEMHAAGERLTYDALRARRGGGSRRDIGRALFGWHAQRADLLAKTALDLPEDIREAGGLFAARMWDRMAKRFAHRIQEMQTDAYLSAYHAEEEIAHLHSLLGDYVLKTERLEAELARLNGEVS